MPFVPLGSRKRVEVLLDADKELITGKMRERDNATVTLHHQVMAGTHSIAHLPVHASYRYAKHPETFGPVRGPPPPFKTANKPWTPAELDPDGMAALRDMDQAPVGANRDGGHCFHGETLRKTRSTPALTRTLANNPVEEGQSHGARAKEAANPISIELNRWKRLAEVTKRDLATMPELHSTIKSTKPPPKKPVVSSGLVNFPKYMLFENSHLKQQDFMRFVAAEELARNENEARQTALQEAMAMGEPSVEVTPTSTSRETGNGKDSDDALGYQTASWGQPRLRGPRESLRQQWAGSAMPSGKSMRSSNPFRMG